MKMHSRNKTTPVDVSERLRALENNLDSKGMNKISCFFHINTRIDQSKGHSRENKRRGREGGG